MGFLGIAFVNHKYHCAFMYLYKPDKEMYIITCFSLFTVLGPCGLII